MKAILWISRLFSGETNHQAGSGTRLVLDPKELDRNDKEHKRLVLLGARCTEILIPKNEIHHT